MINYIDKESANPEDEFKSPDMGIEYDAFEAATACLTVMNRMIDEKIGDTGEAIAILDAIKVFHKIVKENK